VCVSILIAVSVLLMRIIYSGINLPYDENGRYFEDGIVYYSITYISLLLLLIVISILSIIFIPRIIAKLKGKNLKRGHIMY
jgi:hypothetical protein